MYQTHTTQKCTYQTYARKKLHTLTKQLHKICTYTNHIQHNKSAHTPNNHYTTLKCTHKKTQHHTKLTHPEHIYYARTFREKHITHRPDLNTRLNHTRLLHTHTHIRACLIHKYTLLITHTYTTDIHPNSLVTQTPHAFTHCVTLSGVTEIISSGESM